MDERRAELTERLTALRGRIARAAEQAGREPDGIGLVVVTKTYPASDVRLLHDLGVRDVGENKVQEAQAKAAEVAELTDLRWHQVGQLQTNKAGSVARWAHTVHSVDRVKLVNALSRGAQASGRRLRCLIQVSLDGDAARGGALIENVPALADALAQADGLDLGGVMAVAPLGADPRQAFDRLAQVSAQLRAQHPQADVVSAGMSADLDEAIAAGATLLRVGTAVLGSRPPLQ